MRGISFEHMAGYATGISAATSNSITLINPSNVTLAALKAPALSLGYTVFTWRTYTMRETLSDHSAEWRSTIPVSGGVLPTGTSGTETHNGITYLCEGTGTTYTQGQFATNSGGGQWWFHGYSRGVLTDVTTSNSASNEVPDNYDGKRSSVVSSTNNYFASTRFSRGNTGSNTAAFVHVLTGSSFPITGNYFLQSPGTGILLDGIGQNGATNNPW